MTTILTIDLGGSKCDAALWQSSCTQPRLLQRLRFSSNFSDESGLFAQLKPLPDDLEAAVIAVAGHINGEGGAVELTNNPCTINIPRLRALLPAGCRLSLLNDLECLAHALPYLPASSLVELNPHADATIANAPGPRLAAAAGTGFGAALLLPGLRVIPTEAGHTRFAPADEAQATICQRIAADLQLPAQSITAETLLSGAGLARIHHALGGQMLPPQEITRLAQAADPAAMASIQMFSGMLGATLGNLALSTLAGGIYLAGGVLQHLSTLIDCPALMAAFAIPGPFAEHLRQLPIRLINEDAPTLLGAVMYAERFLLG